MEHTINELKAAKNALEFNIIALINEFEQTYCVSVTDINFEDCITKHGNGICNRSVELNIDIKL